VSEFGRIKAYFNATNHPMIQALDEEQIESGFRTFSIQ
jgi:hypothetical protein